MRHLLALYLSIALVTMPLIAYAEPQCTEPVAVTTPCSGVLLPTSAATEGLKCLKIDLPRLTLELGTQGKLWDSREKRYKALLLIEQGRGDQLFKQLQEAITTAKSPWYESPTFFFTMGFVVATAAVIGVTYAVNSPKE